MKTKEEIAHNEQASSPFATMFLSPLNNNAFIYRDFAYFCVLKSSDLLYVRKGSQNVFDHIQ